MSHSPEPWKVLEIPPDLDGFDGYYRIEDVDGRHVATVPTSTEDGNPVGPGKENADLLVACVNACKNVPTELLESGAVNNLFETLLSSGLLNAPVSVKGPQPQSMILEAFLNHAKSLPPTS